MFTFDIDHAFDCESENDGTNTRNLCVLSRGLSVLL